MTRIDRRTFLVTSAAVGCGERVAAGTVGSSGISAGRLRTSMQSNPVGIGDEHPTLSWQVQGPPGTIQSAYRIVVEHVHDAANKRFEAIWDSGRVSSGDCTGIAYRGPTLRSGGRYHWRVMLWNGSDQSSPWSETAFWEMGLLDASDWKGDWLAAESAVERDDRQANPQWVRAVAGPERKRTFRLRFSTRGGAAVVMLKSEGQLSNLSVGTHRLPFPYRDPNGYGGPPASEHRIDLASGDYDLLVDVSTGSNAADAPVDLAGLIRITDAAGAVERFHRGWQIEGLSQGGGFDPAEPSTDQPHFPWPPTPARLFRREFDLPKGVGRARLYISALGGYHVWVNGKPVSRDEMQSEPAEYRKDIPYRTYDIASLLIPGRNVVGVIVGDGNYASYQAPDGRYAYGPAPRRFRAMIRVEQPGGTTSDICTDERWQQRGSPILMAETYNGEDHDRRLWEKGWATANFLPTRWEPVWKAPSPSGRLVAPMSNPIRCVRTVKPGSIRRLDPQTHLVDFGQNFAGRIRLKANGAAGDRLVVRYSEILGADGLPDRRNLRVARAEDRYILAGERDEVLEPMFAYQGFRYAEIEGVGQLSPADVEGLVLSSALDEIGTLRVGHPLIQKLWLNNLWSQRSNFMGIPTDCPQRDERLGWTGDAQIFWDTAAFNMDVGGFTRSFMRVLRADQADNGAFPMWAPSPKGLGWQTTTATPGWADAGVMLPYVTYLHNGDRAIIDENWQAMERYVNGILSTNRDGIWQNDRGADLGDWLALDAKKPGDPTTPKDLIATAMLARSIDQLRQMAEWTGRVDGAKYWAMAHERTRKAFADRFVTPDGTVGNGSHCSYVLALQMGLVPANLRRDAATKLVEDIRKRGSLLSTGFLGTPLALDALADAGYADVVFDLLLRTEYPSWGYMVKRGATTTWERWNGDVGDVVMNSYNHYALGAVCSFLYRRIAGIEPIKPGFREVRIAPLIDHRIGSGGATILSAQGPITTKWTASRTAAQLEIDLPANVAGTVIFSGRSRAVASGRHTFVL